MTDRPHFDISGELDVFPINPNSPSEEQGALALRIVMASGYDPDKPIMQLQLDPLINDPYVMFQIFPEGHLFSIGTLQSNAFAVSSNTLGFGAGAASALTSSGLTLKSSGVVGFAVGSDAGASPDTGISRVAAGQINIGNGAQGDSSGTVVAATFTGTATKTNALNSATTIVNVSSATAPSAGQVLTATDSTHATWQAPASGGISALTGDVTASGSGSVVATLATVNSNVGSFGSSTAIPTFTVNAKGLITAASTSVVIAPAWTLTGATLASGVTASSLTSFGTSPTLTTPTIASFANATHSHQNAAGGGTLDVAAIGSGTLGAARGGTGNTTGTATINANLTGPITSSGNATSIASQTGTGTKFVMDTSPTLVTPTLGVATATSINKVAITAPATSATLTIADGKTFTVNQTLTFTGTTGTTMTFPATSATIARTDAANTFTGNQIITGAVNVSPSSSGATFTALTQLQVEKNGDAGIEIGTPNANISRLLFSTPAAGGEALVRWDHSNLLMSIGTAVGSGGDISFVTGNFSEALRLSSAARATFKGPVVLKGYTVATLPAGAEGMTAYCTDLLAPGFLVAAVGGGAVKGPVFFDGVSWKSY